MIISDITLIFGAMRESRVAPRKRVLKTGTMRFGHGAVDCAVRSLSETGAAISVESTFGIPTDFQLIVPTDHLNREARVIWRKDNRLGVVFD